MAFVAAHEQPVGNLKWKSDLAARYTNPGDVNGVRWCTGTLIAADLMLTAGHCFDVNAQGWTWPNVNGSSNPISSQAGAQEMRVDFNYQNDPGGSPRTIASFDIVALVEYRLGALDYSIVRLAGTPGATFGRSVPSPFSLKVGNDVAIIQHPAGEPKKIHAGQIASLGTSSVSYSVADTLGGSSGSGVLNQLTGYLSAVHTNGGCQVDGSGSNSGVQLTTIWASSPLLRTHSFDAAKLMVVL